MEALARAKKLIKDVPLTDKTRFFLLVGRERRVCVDQSRIMEVGKAMRDPDLMVQYLGTAERGNVHQHRVDQSSGSQLRYVTDKLLSYCRFSSCFCQM